jgi:phosphomannomutase
MIKKRREFSSLDNLAIALRTIEKLSPFGPADQLDGLKWTQDRSWVQVRASNTEPILRIFAEAPTVSEAESLANSILKIIDQNA